MRIATALAVLAGLSLAAPTRAEDPVSLKWSLKEGETMYAKNVADMDMQMTVMDKDVAIKMKITSVQQYKVVSVKPGATKIEMKILSIKTDVEGLPGGAGTGDIGERVKNVVIGATLNNDLEVTKVEGYDKFIDKLADGDENVRKQMKAQFSESMVGQMVSQVFTFAPKKPVKAGDTWERTDKIAAGGLGDATVKQKYKLDSVSGTVAKIALDGALSFKEGDGTIPGLPEGVKIEKFDMKSDKYKGTLQFDTKAGRLVETKLNMDINGAVTMSANGMNVEVKMKIKAVQTSTVTDKNPIKD